MTERTFSVKGDSSFKGVTECAVRVRAVEVHANQPEKQPPELLFRSTIVGASRLRELGVIAKHPAAFRSAEQAHEIEEGVGHAVNDVVRRGG